MGIFSGMFGSTKKAPVRPGTAGTSLGSFFTRSGRNRRAIRYTAEKAAAARSLAATAVVTAKNAEAQVEKAKAAEKEYTIKGCGQLDKDRRSANLSTFQKLKQVRSLGVGALFKRGVTTGNLANAQLKAAMAKQLKTALASQKAAANARARSDAALEAKREALLAAEENAKATSEAATAAENVVKKLPVAANAKVPNLPSNIPNKNQPPATPPIAPPQLSENPVAPASRRSRRSSRRNRR